MLSALCLQTMCLLRLPKDFFHESQECGTTNITHFCMLHQVCSLIESLLTNISLMLMSSLLEMKVSNNDKLILYYNLKICINEPSRVILMQDVILSRLGACRDFTMFSGIVICCAPPYQNCSGFNDMVVYFIAKCR